MRRPLTIPDPTATELDALASLYRTTRDARLRTRAQMVLLAAEQHLTAPAIAAIVRESDQTVRNWLKRWLAEGLAGLHDRPMPGAPTKVTPAYTAQLLLIVRRRPRSLDQPTRMTGRGLRPGGTCCYAMMRTWTGWNNWSWKS